MRYITIFIICINFLVAQTLNFATSKNVGPLNPHLYSPNEMFAQNMVYESLVRYAEDGSIQPWLAKSWDISKDGKTYTFYLRQDIVFSNGEKFDANAVKANFDAINQNKDRHKWLELSNILLECDKIDDYTIQLKLKNAYSLTLNELSLIRPYRFIAPSAMINGSTKDGIKAPIGTGPWKLVSSKLGVNDVFERNDRYYGKKPSYEKIIAKVIPDPNTKFIALKTGDIDLIYGKGQISLDSFALMQKDKKFNTMISKPLITTAIAINSNKFPTNDINIRKAINMAVDKDAIMKQVFFNIQQKADFLFSPTNKLTHIDAKPYEFNTKKANELLEKSGWKLKDDGIRYKDGKALKLELSYIGSDASQKSIGEVLQSELKNIGILLDLKADEKTIFFKKQRTGEFSLIFNATWGAPYDPQSFLASMRAPSHADYQAQLGLKNKQQIDDQISLMLKTIDEKESEKLVKEILTTLHEQAVYIPITYEVNTVVSNKKIDGIEISILKDNIQFDKIFFAK
ncbi:nickel ABC transporter periplasmic nickel-binding protein [Campylobacter sputorum subsp. bubulus]|uniref:Nickel ABC transporter periplasmic nickel-binding protein n=1 Tax=Campylobacter sputorum subsp. sputorum TaxID=32024 RepID=A0A381DI26_9BACT|nr:nickel ABC transporter substrate-binding protein [Campylobacter sputorum]ASM35396.1 dipeptide/oligopeptide/nickel ABC transporter, periplasmic substrate-binding protein [Campylobacter sputorum aubsp. sputorum RM3237]KAB0582860.1 nickel ABC transporter, nickel/metallophore periplasmic binding protein [Campylobacter sputorum subsp. sputorum]QEL05588.1 nickel ABC transporter, periplasmic substrate-binding protein [Campylobacter sputorum subsp. sputorum]SUX08581.1 nickel ABC transporter periplas